MNSRTHLPRWMLTGLQMDEGQNLVIQVLAQLFQWRGVRVRPCLVGSDDALAPMFVRLFKQRPALLDHYLYDERTMGYVLDRFGRDQGIMIAHSPQGLLDGFIQDATTMPPCSALRVALTLKMPVVLTIDATKLSYAVLAYIKGLQTMYPDLFIAGYILCYTQGVDIEPWIQHFQTAVGLTCYGMLAISKHPLRPSIYLVEPSDGNWARASVQWLTAFDHQVLEWAKQSEKQVRLNELVRLAEGAPALEIKPPEGYMQTIAKRSHQSRCIIGYPNDLAFNQYDPANLLLLEDLGAELVPLNTLKDEQLPPALDGLYFGSGHVDSVANEWISNRMWQQSFKHAMNQGMPLWAEGDSMYAFVERIDRMDQTSYGMLGMMPGKAFDPQKNMPEQYVTVQLKNSGLLGSAGDTFKARMKARMQLTKPGAATSLVYETGQQALEGYMNDQMCFLRPRVLLSSQWQLAVRFVDACRTYHDKRIGTGDQIQLWI